MRCARWSCEGPALALLHRPRFAGRTQSCPRPSQAVPVAARRRRSNASWAPLPRRPLVDDPVCSSRSGPSWSTASSLDLKDRRRALQRAETVKLRRSRPSPCSARHQSIRPALEVHSPLASARSQVPTSRVRPRATTRPALAGRLLASASRKIRPTSVASTPRRLNTQCHEAP